MLKIIGPTMREKDIMMITELKLVGKLKRVFSPPTDLNIEYVSSESFRRSIKFACILIIFMKVWRTWVIHSDFVTES